MTTRGGGRALHAALLANRGACNLSLKNYGSVKRDCADVLKLTPGNANAHLRIAKACFELRQYDDALKAIEGGLAVDAEGSELLNLRSKCEAELAKARKREADKRKASSARRRRW